MLIETLEKGFYDQAQFEEVLEDMDKKVKASEADQRFQNTWNIFHSNFDDVEQEFVEELVQRFKEDSQFYSLRDLESSMAVLEGLDKNENAEAILQYYFSAPHKFDYLELRSLENERIRRKAEEQVRNSVERKSIYRVITEMIHNSGWSQEDIDTLQTCSEEDWFTFRSYAVASNSYQGRAR